MPNERARDEANREKPIRYRERLIRSRKERQMKKHEIGEPSGRWVLDSNGDRVWKPFPIKSMDEMLQALGLERIGEQLKVEMMKARAAEWSRPRKEKK